MLSAPEQLAVVRGLRAGDRSAWTTLYDSYSGDVWRYVARLLGADVAAVADVVQEVFMSAARSAGQFDARRGTLSTWLIGIAHHQTSAYWRQASRATQLRNLAEVGAADIRHLFDRAEPQESVWERRELADLVRSVLAELSADYAALLTGKYLDQRSLDELAEQFGGSTSGIKSKLARARREFRTKFEHLSREPIPTARK